MPWQTCSQSQPPRRFSAEWSAVLGGLCCLWAGCSDPALPDLDLPTLPAPAAPDIPCGDVAEAPAGVTLDPTRRSLTVACDGSGRDLMITVLPDSVLRVRYGIDRTQPPPVGSASLVPVTIAAAAPAWRSGRTGNSAVLCTPALTLTVEPGACALRVVDVATGSTVLHDPAEGGFFRRTEAADQVIGVTHASPPDEAFYGLGLHTGTQADGARSRLSLRGAVIDLWNTDAYDAKVGGFPPDSPSLYESIPMYVGLSKGTAYGVFTDSTLRLRVSLAADDPTQVQLTQRSDPQRGPAFLDQYLLPGPSLRDVLRRYTQISGRMPMPAPWSLGFSQSRWEGPCEGSPTERPFCSATQIVGLVREFRRRGIPLDGVFLDIQHMNGFRSFTFDPARFDAPTAFFSELASLGVHAVPIIDPGIKQDPGWDVYQGGLAGRHFVLQADGKGPYVGEVWPGAAVFPDFSADATRKWWADHVSTLAQRGIYGAWIDMNEPANFRGGSVPNDLPVDGNGHPSTMAALHNAYAFFEAQATAAGLAAAHPDERPFVLSRAAFAGQQAWSAVWTGDAPSTWTTLGMTLPQLLHLGLSGMAFSGSDVGGYSGRAESTGELYARWLALGVVSPFFRAHAEKDARRQEPWAFGEEASDAAQALIRLRYELFPYLYSLFDECTQTGWPVLRPLIFEFQDDPRLQTVADQAMLGPTLLVAPILQSGRPHSRRVLLPKGRWFDLRSGATFAGGDTVELSAAPDPLPLDALPLFAREGAIVPRSQVRDTAQATLAGPLYLDAFPGAQPSRFTLRHDAGTASPTLSRVTFVTWRGEGNLHLAAGPRSGAFVPPQRTLVLRVYRVDHGVREVLWNGASLPSSQYRWDENDRALVLTLPYEPPFSLDVALDTTLRADGTVDVPVRVLLPPGTPDSTAIHIASASSGWTHQPLARSGQEATGFLPAPRGGYTSFKVTRGSWGTVEKGAACDERPNRVAAGSATRGVDIRVQAWADRCP